jgi:hypothetical protein
MLHSRVLPFALTLLLVSPAASFAASATQSAYDDVDTAVQDDTTSGSDDESTPSDTTSATPAPSATSTSSLPFTGLEAGLIAAAGLGLAGTGVALRRAAREQ